MTAKSFDPTALLEKLRGQELAKEHWAGIDARTLDNPRARTERTIFKRHFRWRGWVSTYSDWLDDDIILVRDDMVTVPSHIRGVIYTVDEVTQLVLMDWSWSLHNIRNLHRAKRELDATLL